MLWAAVSPERLSVDDSGSSSEEEIARLKQEAGKHLLAHGGGPVRAVLGGRRDSSTTTVSSCIQSPSGAAFDYFPSLRRPIDFNLRTRRPSRPARSRTRQGARFWLDEAQAPWQSGAHDDVRRSDSL